MPKRVLIVDDNEEIVHATILRLRAAGYVTSAAYDGEQGVSVAAHDQPDAILLDIRMPKKDGLAALAELKQREDTRQIPVVMVSASVVDQPVALENGARFFLRKPYTGGQLVDALHSLIPAQGKR